MVPSLTANCNSTLSNHTVGNLQLVLSGLPWQPWIGFFAGITPPKTLTSIKVELQEASKQFKEGGDTQSLQQQHQQQQQQQSQNHTNFKVFLEW